MVYFCRENQFKPFILFSCYRDSRYVFVFFLLMCSNRDQIKEWTRMHSSRMRTARLLLISPSMHCSWGVYLTRGIPTGRLPAGGCTCPARGCTCREGVPAWGDVPAGGVPTQGVYLRRGYLPQVLHPCGQTDTCKNITFANFLCGR